MVECSDFAPIRQRFYIVNNMKELFEDVEVNSVLSFLKAVDLYLKIYEYNE